MPLNSHSSFSSSFQYLFYFSHSTLLLFHIHLLLCTHSLDPCKWGGPDLPACGPPAAAYPFIWPLRCVHKSRGDNVVHMWIQLKRLCVLQRGRSDDGCDLALTFCMYDFRKGDLFALSWARVRRGRRGVSLQGC